MKKIFIFLIILLLFAGCSLFENEPIFRVVNYSEEITVTQVKINNNVVIDHEIPPGTYTHKIIIPADTEHVSYIATGGFINPENDPTFERTLGSGSIIPNHEYTLIISDELIGVDAQSHDDRIYNLTPIE